MKSARPSLALSRRDYLANTRRLKRLLTGHAVPEPAFDAAELLDTDRRRFGSAMVTGFSIESLGWLLLMNSRAVATLAPPAQLDALQACLEQLVANAVPGDVIEAGCFRGGHCVFMSGVLKALGDTERRIIAADSFQDLPPPDLNLAPDHAVMHFLLGAIGGFRASLKQQDLEALEDELETALIQIQEEHDAMAETLEPLDIGLEKTDIRVAEAKLVWVPVA